MSNIDNIGWYPGHMAKAKRYIQANMSLVDMVIELRDCRIPESSKNPNIQKVIGEKPKLIVLNKSSLADKTTTDKWISCLKEEHTNTVAVDCKSLQGFNTLIDLIPQMMSEKLEYFQRKGMYGRNLRAMVVGVTNVGKSTFFNTMSRTKKAKTENKPGLTRTTQWIKTPYGVELLDTPGLLWEKLENKHIAINLALTGAIRDEVIDILEISWVLCEKLRDKYPELLAERYKLTDISGVGHEIFETIARKRGFLISGGGIDEERCATMLLEEFRSGKIGRISLETPEEIL
ncbi:MAG: ribosome biogenesis GTPase YlqF [Clostridiales bacterium GWF2_38_85]|nr:MAG: ribosome biogenesis GTPase YlqF [Clostridiales bacterium GWF2_38_85]HBL84592.1 ribosome biogenesis GTPase YlqF [Clostridiales bacterium]